MTIPLEGWLALLIVASIVAQPARVFLMGLVCLIFNVPERDISKYVLDQARKGHPSPVIETVETFVKSVTASRAVRDQRDSGPAGEGATGGQVEPSDPARPGADPSPGRVPMSRQPDGGRAEVGDDAETSTSRT